jgi:hypothetical protein
MFIFQYGKRFVQEEDVKQIESLNQKISTIITSSKNNTELVEKMRAAGFQNIQIDCKKKNGKTIHYPPPDAFSDIRGFNRMDLAITATLKDSGGNNKQCTIYLKNEIAALKTDEGVQVLGLDNKNVVLEKAYKHMGLAGLTDSECRSVVMESINKDPTSLKSIGNSKLTKINEQLPYSSEAERAEGKKLIDDGKYKEYVDYIKSKGLYDQFIDFMAKELQKMAGSGEVSGAADRLTGYITQNILTQNILTDQQNEGQKMVAEREKKAGDDKA